MGRIRTIKPEFLLHEGLYDLEVETGLPVRLAFAGLWTQCDREGRFRWQPRKLKVTILPYDELDFSRVLDALSTRGFVVKYACSGEEFGYVPSFLKHQVINNREKESELPEPNEINTLTREPRVSDACPTVASKNLQEGKGREGKGKDINTMSEASASDVHGSNDDSESEQPDPKYTPDDYRLAEWMAKHVIRVAPKSKPPKLNAWAEIIRLMRERDNHSHHDIATVFTFANNDSFWSVNILSPTKLREKFGELDAKMRRESNEKTGSGYRADRNERGISGAERTRRAREQARIRERSL